MKIKRSALRRSLQWIRSFFRSLTSSGRSRLFPRRLLFEQGIACLFFLLLFFCISRQIRVLFNFENDDQIAVDTRVQSSSIANSGAPGSTFLSNLKTVRRIRERAKIKMPYSKQNSTNTRKTSFHLVFSTGCSADQDWQSYAFFYHILKSGQEGDVTRVASGCTIIGAMGLKQHFKTKISPMAPDRFHLFLTPDFSKSVLPNVKYKFFNKPYGLQYWMKNGLKYEENRDALDDKIFIILDPDQIVLRPFRQSYEDDDQIVFHWPHSVIHKAVTHGHPMAQVYMFGSNWVDKLVPAAIFNHTHSPVAQWTRWLVGMYFAAGPPYIATGRDTYNIVTTWAQVSAPVYQQTKDHLSEMFAYSVAAGHLNLKHQLVYSFMISNPEVRQEGWSLIDGYTTEQLFQNHNGSGLDPVPNVIHYCQKYNLGPWWFFKYLLNDNFLFNCMEDLFDVPNCCDHLRLNDDGSPTSFTTMDKAYNWALKHPTGERVPLNNALHRKRHAFILHRILTSLNDAAIYYRQHHCKSKGAINTNKTFIWKFARSTKQKLDEKASIFRDTLQRNDPMATA